MNKISFDLLQDTEILRKVQARDGLKDDPEGFVPDAKTARSIDYIYSNFPLIPVEGLKRTGIIPEK